MSEDFASVVHFTCHTENLLLLREFVGKASPSSLNHHISTVMDIVTASETFPVLITQSWAPVYQVFVTWLIFPQMQVKIAIKENILRLILFARNSFVLLQERETGEVIRFSQYSAQESIYFELVMSVAFHVLISLLIISCKYSVKSFAKH